MDKSKDLRKGRHCVFAMYVHLVFVTKYRRCVLDGEAIEKLRQIFSKVCTDFEALLAQIDGASNHVHLLVQYPPKVSVSSLVNSLKGVSSYVLRRPLPRIAKCTGRMCCGRLLTSPHHMAAHRSTQSNATSSANHATIVAAYPDLNSGACATRWSGIQGSPILSTGVRTRVADASRIVGGTGSSGLWFCGRVGFRS